MHSNTNTVNTKTYTVTYDDDGLPVTYKTGVPAAELVATMRKAREDGYTDIGFRAEQQ